MISVAVNGACGRVGARLVALIQEAPDLTLGGALERANHPAQGKDVGLVVGAGAAGVLLTADVPDGVDVLVDFSSPTAAGRRARECAEKGVAFVTGTTGLTEDDHRAIRSAAERVPCLASPNMSLGVNLLFRLAPRVARALGEEADIEIIEAHHRFKKDAPSGTALRLAENIAAALGLDAQALLVHGRSGETGNRPRRQIGVHAVRGGDIVGDHTVVFACLGERIELVHRAHSRDTFCRGALAAARFLVGKAPGLYTMDAVLGLDAGA